MAATSDLVAYLEAAGAKPSSNNEMVLTCPWCSAKQHLYVSTVDAERNGKLQPAGRFICFKCQERGYQFHKLYAELEGVSLDEARASVARWRMAGLQWRRDAFKTVETPKTDSWLPPEFEPVWDGRKWIWPKYLTRRGVSRDVAHMLGLGCCRRHDKCEHCRRNGGCDHDYSSRIILPIVNPTGRSFAARSWLSESLESLRYKSGPDAGQLIFGWQTFENEDHAVIVEGPFDALRVIEAGFPCGALQGKSLRDAQRATLSKRPRRYTVLLDNGAWEDAIGIAKELDGLVARCPTKDPGSMPIDLVKPVLDKAMDPRDAILKSITGRVTGLRTMVRE